MKFRSYFLPGSIFILLITVLCTSGCKKVDIKTNTTDDVNIVGYLEKNSDSFSLFNQILIRTETSAFLNAYGAYTVFAPTNSGVKQWLTSIGAASVEAADMNVLKEMVKFHILEDTVTTGSFKDGKLPVPTMHGQYLIAGAGTSGGGASYIINRQAAVLQSNIRVGNGFIHVIDHVLVPAKLTIADQLDANPDYSIFVQALKATGYFTLLDNIDPDPNKRWKTVIAESNQALADSGITSYQSLFARYSNTSNPANPLDSLNLYVAYHIMDGVKFLGDIITVSSHLTMQPQEVITVNLINNEVILNEVVFNNVLEPGVQLLRSKSDNAATNGVWHHATAHFAAKARKPTAVFWDLSAFPEVMKMATVYKKNGTFTFNKLSAEDKPIKDYDWHYNGENYMRYEYGNSPTATLYNFACNNDILTVPLGNPATNNRATWAEFITPPIVKGRYKVWICYRNRNAVTVQVRVDGELLERTVNLGQGYPGGTDAERESLGWKRYTLGGSFAGRNAGIVDIRTTDRHVLRLEAIAGSNRDNHLDMVHFIPIEDNQWLPRFAPDGSMVWQ